MEKMRWYLSIGKNIRYSTISFFVLLFLIIPTAFAQDECDVGFTGCFDHSETRVFSGMHPVDFFYYCDLNAQDEKLIYYDPDSRSESCNCIGGATWLSNHATLDSSDSSDDYLNVGRGGCCGDDQGDCGIVVDETRFTNEDVIDRHLCVLDSDFQIGQWFSADIRVGQIIHAECRNQDFLSLDGNWTPCDNATILYDQNTYACDPLEQKWHMCCGDDVCNGINRLQVGETYYLSEDANATEIEAGTYYCATDKSFTKDLDSKDQRTCEQAGLVWTGSLCCSEDDDGDEFYNDIDGTGGCWNKTAILSGSAVTEIPAVANFGGEFLGCNIPGDNETLALADSQTGEALVQNVAFCYQDAANYYLCDTDRLWKIVDTDLSHYSTAPIEFNPDRPAGCCAPTDCWDGNVCVGNQAGNPSAQVGDYRCIGGSWTRTSAKFTPEGREGFCPREDQCLVDPFGEVADNDQTGPNPQCIANTQFDGINYCENGNWTTRTKFLALQLLDKANTGGDYILFCDTAESAVANLAQFEDNILIDEIFPQNSNNNVCILLQGSDITVGTTLDGSIEQNPLPLDLFNLNNCDGALNYDGYYVACDSENLVWYNHKMQSIIYSDKALSIGTTNPVDVFAQFLLNPFRAILDLIDDNIQEPFDESYVDLRNFNKLYIAKQGTKTITATLDKARASDDIPIKNIVAEYTDFGTDICSYVEIFDAKFEGDFSGIECNQTDSTAYVLAQGSSEYNLNPEDIWNDLTSKLRIE